MSDPFLGEIRALSFNWAPDGWALCDGATLLIQQNTALYSLLGIQFGGDGKTNFKLPDMRGRIPLCSQYASNQGKAGGAESVALTAAQTPPHNHLMQAVTAAGNQVSPKANFYALAQTSPGDPIYGPASSTVALDSGTISPAGTGGAHNNMQPFQVINYCISLRGIYPPRT